LSLGAIAPLTAVTPVNDLGEREQHDRRREPDKHECRSWPVPMIKEIDEFSKADESTEQQGQPD
jgi:hypothetical protein